LFVCDSEAAATAWTLAASDIVEDDIIDSDTVLDADDFKKPDPSSLRSALYLGFLFILTVKHVN